MALDDPILEIEAAIKDARQPGALDAAELLDLDPLSSLRFRIAQAHPAATLEPLYSLFESLASDQQLSPPTSYEHPEDPMDALRKLVRGEIPANDNATASSGVSPSVDEAQLGSEVANILSSRPLSPAARTEAVRRALIAIENPTAENARAVLAALLSE